MTKKKQRRPTDGGAPLTQNPFAGLDGLDLPAGVTEPIQPERKEAEEAGFRPKRGRVDIVRQTAHRGGKTVTVISGWSDVTLAEVESIAKRLQKACGSGGTVKKGQIEIQGDQRQLVAEFLRDAGFRPVFAGG